MAPSKKKQKNNTTSFSRSSKHNYRSVKKYHCSTCNVSFTSMSTFLNHLSVNKFKKCLEKYKIKCECCHKPFGRSSELSQHYDNFTTCYDYKQNGSKLSGLIPSSKRTKLIENSLVYVDVNNDSFSINDDNEDRSSANHPSASSNHLQNQSKLIGKKYTFLHNEKTHNKKEPPIKTFLNITDTTVNELHTLKNSKENMYSVATNRRIAHHVSDQPQAIFDYHDHSCDNLSRDRNVASIQPNRLNHLKDSMHQIDLIRHEQFMELERISTEYRNILRDEELQEQFETISIDSHTSLDSFSDEINENIVEDYDLNPIRNVEDDVRDPLRNTNQHPSSQSYFDATEYQNRMNKHLDNFHLNDEDIMCIDLFQMLRASNAPLGLYDKIISWLHHHQFTIRRKSHSTKFPTREKLINRMSSKIYHNPTINRSKVTPITLSSGRTTSIVTFSMKEIILKTINNTSLFTKDNILLNINDPTTPPLESDYYSEVNSGSWHLNSLRNEQCDIDNATGRRISNGKLLMPWTFFIDGLKTDKFGKITVEAVLTSCLWFNRRTRNRSSAWNILGFVEDQKLFRKSNTYVRDEKAQDYHDMMSHIFSEFKGIYDSGGMKVRIDLSKCNGVNKEYVILPVIQFIIGDCKGNDLLCGRMAGHSLMMKGGCRDCDISPNNLDDIPSCNNDNSAEFSSPCKFHDKSSIVGKTALELKSMSFLDIHNAFSSISFGGCDRSIWGATPLEILHAVQLGLCEYVSESLENVIFTAKPFEDVLSKTASEIAINSTRQSERDLPSLSPFRHGLVSVKTLKATERFARVYCLYLAFANTYCIKSLTTYPMLKENGRRLFTFDYLRGLFATMEQLLIFHQWLKEEKIKKEHFLDGDDGTPSKAMQRVISFMTLFKRFITRPGNNLKTPKFHQILHIVDYIQRFGAPNNWDGSRGEHFGKTLVKDNAKLTNRRKETLNYDISRRMYESNVMDDTCRIYFDKKDRWPSTYCNDTDLVNGTNDVDVQNIGDDNDTKIELNMRRPCYMINAKKRDLDDSNHFDDQEDMFDVHIEWKKKGNTPMENIPLEVQKRLYQRLFTGSGQIGGKVVLTSTYTKIPCYTHVHVNHKIVRCHPYFGDKGSWYDWAFFHYDIEGESSSIPGRLLMIIDLSDVSLETLDRTFFDVDEDLTNIPTFEHLTNEPWVVIQSAEILDIHSLDERDAMFDSLIIQRVKIIEDDKIWLVPLSSIRNVCCLILNNDYLNPIQDNGKHPTDNTGYLVRPMSTWGKMFLNDD